MSKVGARILVAVAVVSLAANFWLFRSLQAERRQLDAALASLAISSSAPNTALETAAPKATAESIVEEPAPVHAAMKSGAPVQPPPVAKTVAPKTTEECTRLRAEAMRAKWREPVNHRSLRQDAISVLTTRDGGAQRELGVNAEQLNRLYEIHVDQSMQDFLGGQSNVSWAGSPEMLTNNSAVYQGIASEFGDAMARKWAEYRRTENGRAWTRAINSQLANVDASLSADQRQKLTVIYSDISASLDRDLGNAEPDMPARSRDLAEYIDQLERNERRESERSKRLQQAASGFLSAEQLALVRLRGGGSAAEVYRSRLQQLHDNPAEFAALRTLALHQLDRDGC